MEKNTKSIFCPECCSVDVDMNVGYLNANEQETLYEGKQAFEYSKDMVMYCQCKKCNTKYSVNRGNEVYTILKKPLSLTNCGDIKLISFYTSQFGYDFKLVKMSQNTGRPIVMAYVEDQEYPIVMPSTNGIEKDLQRVKTLIYNTRMNRYR